MFAVLLTQIQNKNAIKSSKNLFVAVLDERFYRISELVLEYGYWDEAVKNLTVKANPNWIENNFGSYLYETLGVAEAHVLNEKNKTVFSSVEGGSVALDTVSLFGGGMDALISLARETPDDVEPIPHFGVLQKDGSFYVVAAVRMTTYFTLSGVEVDRSTDFIMLFAQKLDENFLEDISERFALPNLRLSPETGSLWQASVPIRTFDGAVHGYFLWEPVLPGMEMLPKLATALGVVFLVMLATSVWFFRKVTGVAQSLEAARSEADRANAAKSELLRNVAHEVRTPANAILGFSKIMEEGMFGPLGHPKYAEYARDIGRAGNHVIAVTDDLLDLARIEAGEMEPSLSVLDVEETLASAVALVKPLAEAKQVVLVYDMTDGLPTVRTDTRMLTQVLLNLLGNAVKFTPDGGRVQCRAFSSPDGMLALQVEDNGPGIAPEDIPQVLEPFGQVRSAQRDGFHGTGLGLPIARKLTEALGGNFQFQSTLGLGTSVMITLPAI